MVPLALVFLKLVELHSFQVMQSELTKVLASVLSEGSLRCSCWCSNTLTEHKCVAPNFILTDRRRLRRRSQQEVMWCSELTKVGGQGVIQLAVAIAATIDAPSCMVPRVTSSSVWHDPRLEA